MCWKFRTCGSALPVIGATWSSDMSSARTRSEDFPAAAGERFWLFLYAPASFLYRIAVMLGIAIFIASQYRVVGVAIAIWGLLTGVALPVGKALWQVMAGPRFQRHRSRAVRHDDSARRGRCDSAVLSFPRRSTRRPKAWCGCRKPPMCAPERTASCAACWSSRASVVKVGEALVESEDVTLKAEARKPARPRRRARSEACGRTFHRPRARRRLRPPSWAKREPSWRRRHGAPSGSSRAAAARARLRC